jgi:magnesium transporter
MEAFAENERKELNLPGEGRSINGQEGMRQRRNGGGGSEEDLAPQSYDTAMDRTNTMSAFGDDPESTAFSPKESDSAHNTGNNHAFHRRRQRKLSQSNPVLRRGGRLALFEGIGTQATPEEGIAPADHSAPVPFKARAPKNPLSAANGAGFAPYTDTPAGHDRPYRFSFYSNNLPVTIHARTLAELPAEGQTFEDLFKGRATMDETRGVPADGSLGQRGSVDSTPRRSTSGQETPEKEPQMAQPNGKMSLLARAAGTASKAGGMGPGQGGSPEHDPEAFTWWMDVHSPTDEEMRMLSKVRLL